MNAQQIQQALIGLNPDYRERFEKERLEFYETVWNSPLPPNFDKYRQFLGSVVNETALGITARNYATLFFSADLQQYNVGNMVAILQASERASLNLYMQGTRRVEGVNPISEWCDLREAMEIITNEINPLIEGEMTKVIKKLQALQHNLIPAQSHDTGGYKAGKNNISLS